MVVFGCWRQRLPAELPDQETWFLSSWAVLSTRRQRHEDLELRTLPQAAQANLCAHPDRSGEVGHSRVDVVVY